jgi:class 3 adenylate cyclase
VDVQIRVGLNSGEVVVRAIDSDLHMDYSAVGQTTYLAAQMERLARPGSTLLAPETRRLTEGFLVVTGLGPVPVKGITDPVEVYELTGAGPARTAEAAAVHGPRASSAGGRAAASWGLRPAAPGDGRLVGLVGEQG